MKNFRRAAAILGSVVTLAFAAPSSPAQAASLPSLDQAESKAYVYLKNWNSGKCLEIGNGSEQNGARAQQWTCKGQFASQWILWPASNGNYWIYNVNSSKCLEIADSRTDNGAPVQQWDCKDIRTQEWQWASDTSQGGAYFINSNSGQVLEIADSRTDNGAPAQQWNAASEPHGQVWEVMAR